MSVLRLALMIFRGGGGASTISAGEGLTWLDPSGMTFSLLRKCLASTGSPPRATGSHGRGTEESREMFLDEEVTIHAHRRLGFGIDRAKRPS